jgi:formylglycine-generating enzyme required for sulfatase activity
MARWRASDKKHRDSLVLSRGLPLTEALDLMRRWGAELPGEVAEFIGQSRRVAKRRLQRLVLALTGSVVSLPILAGIVWAVMVWWGVRTVEKNMAFVAIPQGCFTMGTPADEVGRFDHESQRRVCVPAFELGTFAVTQEEWRRVMVENPDPARFKGNRNPVEMVNWDDARAFIWRMRFFGKHNYRLPSEAEWEYAARAGTTTTWFWGDKLEDGCAYANVRDLTYKNKYFNVDEAIINCADGHVETAQVGSLKPNQFGLSDMIGNVFQWTQDCFGNYADAPLDGSAAEAKNCASRVVRGGSWTARPRFTRSGSRDTYPPVNRNDVVGFRVAR